MSLNYASLCAWPITRIGLRHFITHRRGVMPSLLRGRVTDALDFGVLVEPGHTVLAAEPAGLIATERGIRAVGRGAVEADKSGPQPLCHRHRVLDRSRHHIARKPIHAVIGNADRVFLVVVRNHDENGAEDLLLGDRHLVIDVGEKRWPDEESLAK